MAIVSMFASRMGTLNVHAEDGKGREMYEPGKLGCRPKIGKVKRSGWGVY